MALAALTLVLPENVPNFVIPLTYTFAIYHLAKTYQGEAFAAHLASGGLRHSSWRVTGVGLAFLLAVFAVLMGIIMLLPEGLLPQ